MENKPYKVLWTSYARVALASMKEFKVDPMNVFRSSKAILISDPESKAYGVSDFPGFGFNGYYWTIPSYVLGH